MGRLIGYFMKKTQFPNPACYSVAMATETGCIVMVRDSGKERTVVGSLTREDSIRFANELLFWGNDAVQEDSPEPIGDAIN